jgi:uncharacterized membrane protein YgdD (TMEM256/DUF423 family)
MASPTETFGRIGFIGAIGGFLAVALGAFGTHGLEGAVTPARIDTFETGVRYHLGHALALLAVAALGSSRPSRALAWAGRLFVAGILVFSGSLYLLVLLDQPWLGAVTPLGGVSFLLGWVLLAAHFRGRGAGDAGEVAGRSSPGVEP